jgi:hypothetical protein
METNIYFYCAMKLRSVFNTQLHKMTKRLTKINVKLDSIRYRHLLKSERHNFMANLTTEEIDQNNRLIKKIQKTID